MSISTGPSEGGGDDPYEAVFGLWESKLDEIEPGDQQITPDPSLVEALVASMHTYERHTGEDSGRPWHWRLSCAYPDSDRFNPPSDLSPADRRTPLEGRFWGEWARYVSRHARERAFGEQTSMKGDVRDALTNGRPEIKNLELNRVASGAEKGDVRLWWNLDSSETTPDDAVRASKALLADITVRL
ncbi:MAG: hypothetical protein Q8P27_01130 [Candidatus Peregrinibacteria bacterium]|nr:hypothetical protein [Candidatus Peregrinibacteria bacterium]